MIGKPISDPVSAVSRSPFSTDGIYSLGTLPPLISSKNWKPDPRSPGTTLILISPNWPEPPDCFLVRVGEFHRLREILAIGNLRSADVGLDLELALHAVDED